MDRCALFVDANYALSEGALVVHGTRNRDSVSWDYAGLLKLLGSLSRDRTGLPLLRCYWYDTAADGARAAEHEALADIPGVKLRLSKARPSRKEGVETEIRKDLTALARNRGVSDVIVVSAEEDLAPVIAEVQDLGIRTVLFHLASDADWAISRTLRQECDDIIEIGAAHLQPYVDLISGAEPQLPAAAFRELTGVAQASGPHAAIEAPAVRLYESALAAEFDHAQLAGTAAGLTSARRQDAATFGGPGEPPPLAQVRPEAQHEHARQPAGQSAQAEQHYQRPEPRRDHSLGGAQAGYEAVGQPGLQAMNGAGESGFTNQHGQAQFAQPQFAQPSFDQSQLNQSQLTPAQLSPAQLSQAQPGQPRFTQAQPGPAHHGQNQPDANPLGQPQPGVPGLAGNGGTGQAPGGYGAHGTGHQVSAGLQPAGQPGNGVAPAGMPASAMSAGPVGPASAQGNGMQPGGLHSQGNGPANGMAPGGVASNGGPVHGMPAGPGGVPGPISRGGAQQPGGQPGNGRGASDPLAPAPSGAPTSGQYLPGGQAAPAAPVQSGPRGQVGQPAPSSAARGQPGYAQPAPGLGQQPGQSGPNMPPPGMSSNGLMPSDGGRQPLPQRNLPPGSGMPYSQDRSMPYGGLDAQPQFNGNVAAAGYEQNAYGSQQAAVAPMAMPVGEAVHSAHAEGFGFGEAVARDAPALWLEAVLARKPRMPSDLEARLLQGSALPIDSLLHDEVRHALRRGFWDALERSRH